MPILLLFFAIIVLLVLFAVSLYNRLVRLRNNREQAFADVDVQLKQRHDMIPQLVEAVKGYMVHERGVLTEVTEARANAMKATTINEKIVAETRLSSALDGLKVSVEAYPDLKASQNFMQLQDELSDTENKIQASRRFYNGNVRDFNTKIQVFPTNMIAGLLGFKKYDFFQIEQEEKQAPKVEF